jgi:hypothetical protein
MPLEGGDGFISGLVVTNPVNATDQVAQGDDHLRLIKTALKGSFPNISGAVTGTQAELNILDGATLSTAELNILDGVTLTAAQINNAALQAQSNVFTTGRLDVASASADLYWVETDAAANNSRWRAHVNFEEWSLDLVDDAITAATSVIRVARTNNTADILELSAAILSMIGPLTTPNTTASEVGYKGAPQNIQNGDYGIVLTDCGKTIYKASGGAGETITIPANGTIAIPVGSIIRVVNRGGGDLSIAITSDTLELAGAGTTGTRTLADKGVAVLEKVEATIWMISGAGVS